MNSRCHPSGEFWSALDDFVGTSEIVIDRPKGSRHPRYNELVYPIDYGYLAGTRSGDGESVDIWVGNAPEKDVGGLVVSIDLLKNDAEIKILAGCTSVEIAVIEQFLNQHTMHAIIIDRAGEKSILDCLDNRQSIRNFTQEPISDIQIQRILSTAIRAPSAHNRQPWRFIILKSSQAREAFALGMGQEFRRDLAAEGIAEIEVNRQVARSIKRINSAPIAVLLCLDCTKQGGEYGSKQYLAEYVMGIQSVAMAGENILLAAHLSGLGAVWLCAPLFAKPIIHQVIDIPQAWDPQGLILIGYPESVPPLKTRQSLHEVSVVL